MSNDEWNELVQEYQDLTQIIADSWDERDKVFARMQQLKPDVVSDTFKTYLKDEHV